MQYATMIDLIEEAKKAGQVSRDEAFQSWLDTKSLGEISEEEEEALRAAFVNG